MNTYKDPKDNKEDHKDHQEDPKDHHKDHHKDHPKDQKDHQEDHQEDQKEDKEDHKEFKNKLIIGHHVSKTNLFGKLKSFPNYINAFQVAVTPLTSFGKGNAIENSEKIIELKTSKNIYGVVHGKYLYNFARKSNSYQVKILLDELSLAYSIGCNLIIHQGKNVKEEKQTNDQALINFKHHISNVLKGMPNDQKLILENSAHQGTEMGYSLDELHKIYMMFSSEEQNKLGFCIDLCHIFVAGELDLRNAIYTNDFFEKFNELIGIHKLECIHFNDSNIKFNGKNDEHADIGWGYIGNPLYEGNLEGFSVVKNWCFKYAIPMILETPTKDQHFIEQIETIMLL